MRRLVALLASSLLAAVAPAAPVPTHLMKPAAPVYYFPVAVGAKWVYAGQGRDEELVVTDVDEVDGRKVVTVQQVAGEQLTPDEKMGVSAAGLSRSECKGQKCDPPLHMLTVPFKPGQAVTWKSDNIEGTDTIVGVERVKVPAGTFEAVRVDSSYTFGGVTGAAQFWYAPGVGLVKMTYDGGKERVLKAFTPAK